MQSTRALQQSEPFLGYRPPTEKALYLGAHNEGIITGFFFVTITEENQA